MSNESIPEKRKRLEEEARRMQLANSEDKEVKLTPEEEAAELKKQEAFSNKAGMIADASQQLNTASGNTETGGMLASTTSGIAMGAQTGSPIGAAAGGILGATAGVLGARATRKAKLADVEAQKQRNLAEIEASRNARVQEALNGMRISFSNALQNNRSISLGSR
jgi:hypothetical protein